MRSNNGHMIKFAFFESDTSYQCHFSEIGTFVVSIAHYMRAYFNYQALVHGEDFELPSDAGYLNVRNTLSTFGCLNGLRSPFFLTCSSLFVVCSTADDIIFEPTVIR